jgi:hypothetical protein
MSYYKTIIIDDIKYNLVPADESVDEFINIDELAKITKYAVQTLYKKKSNMTEGVHFLQQNNGKILFNREKSVAFLFSRESENENKQRKSVPKKKQQISIHKLDSQWKEDSKVS